MLHKCIEFSDLSVYRGMENNFDTNMSRTENHASELDVPTFQGSNQDYNLFHMHLFQINNIENYDTKNVSRFIIR